MAKVKLKGIRKVFGKDNVVIKDFSLEVPEGEFLVLVGPSGCGKSTLLRIIAGLEEPTEGDVFIGERLVTNIPPKDRDVAMVFQNYALYPHLNVFDNLAFGLKLRKVPRQKIKERVHEAAKILEIQELLKRKPKELSGGQRQRVALGRAIVRKPQVFLFDEPLSNLDAKLRVQMRAEIKRLHNRLRTTMIYVTHDQVEAMTMGDRIVILKDGAIQQVGSPREVYKEPANIFVGGFIGSPAMNFLPGTLSGNTFSGEGFSLEFSAREIGLNTSLKLIMGIRPEDIKLGGNEIFAELLVVEPLGPETILHLQLGGEPIIVKTTELPDSTIGTKIGITFSLNKVYFFNGETGERIV